MMANNMNKDNKINNLRDKIDTYDDKIMEILVERFRIVKEIGQIKSTIILEIENLEREKEIVDRLSDKLKGKIERKDIFKILEPIFEISKKFQEE
ncbi:MAG: hypothetical protein CMG74_10855 [Candidatus Marinimicrobia bacterium]|nr:hypothetical protein [Candidatus Neomarinimicrobiota bacterium]|tara:strand:+ start:2407 stop:2691 length:285 start_codon:yes stop_codon:yes gene_type:complete